MAIKNAPLNDPGVYFITFTNYRWLPLFSITQSYDLVYKWFDYLKSENNQIIGYVIMPNHVHVLIAFNNSPKSINTIISNGKRFIAYELISRLKQNSQTEMLQILAEGVSTVDKRKGQLHVVFEPSFDAKICNGFRFINQKLLYMHANPISKKWTLAADAVSYTHSSAMFYETGKQGCYEIMNYMDLVNSDWVKDV